MKNQTISNTKKSPNFHSDVQAGMYYGNLTAIVIILRIIGKCTSKILYDWEFAVIPALIGAVYIKVGAFEFSVFFEHEKHWSC